MEVYKMKKRLLSIVLAVAMTLGLAAFFPEGNSLMNVETVGAWNDDHPQEYKNMAYGV